MIKMQISIGDRFGKLTILNEESPRIRSSGSHIRKDRRFNCLCDCGKIKIITMLNLRNGDTKSCGCNKVETGKRVGLMSKKHGQSRTPLYKVYHDMKSRCSNSNHSEYHNYGGRGITVCDLWMNDFMEFYNWAVSSGYKKGLDIDRRDNNKGYSPNNCRWVPRVVNRNNQRDTFLVEWMGKVVPIADLCRSLGVDRAKVYRRITRDRFTIERALTKP